MPDNEPTQSERARNAAEPPTASASQRSETVSQLTKEQSAKLESLLQWQESSAKSVIVLGKPLKF